MAEGAVALAPNAIRANSLPPQAVIEEVRVDGKLPNLPAPRALPGEAAPLALSHVRSGALALGPGRHVVEFRYTASSLVAPAKVRFRYRLDGAETEWRGPDSARSGLYSLTAPGQYRFRVTACNNDGVWSPAEATLTLTVAPYVWQTWWFRLGGLAALLLAAGWGIRLHEQRKVHRQFEQLEAQQLVERERARIARDIHDDLGASLTEIGLLSEFAQRDSTPPEQVKADVREIAAQARSSTRALDEIVWAVNPRNDTLEGFVTYACAYAEEQLRLAGIRCRLEAASPLPRRPVRADVRHHLFMAFKETLTNVVKHAGATRVEIRMAVEEDQLIVEVRDNGRGFDPRRRRREEAGSGAEAGAASATTPSLRSGNGLINMQERLESVGGAFACESAPGQGTRVTLGIKLE
jgi:signal transduction histidine kinase